MVNIAETLKIEIKKGYTAQVNLFHDMFNEELNSERMRDYMPIDSHRRVFEEISKGLIAKDNKRCYVLYGSYGTGKSHLCLMFANYLTMNSEDSVMADFFNNYKEKAIEDDKTGNNDEIERKIMELSNIRKNKKKYLIALCEDSPKDNFMEIVLKGINKAFVREKLDINEFDSIYLEAIRKIEYFEKIESEGGKRFFSELKQEISKKMPGKDVEGLKKKLKEYDSEALKIFKDIHKEITAADFIFDKDNLVDIIQNTVKSNVFKEKFDGLLILFDEFDNVIRSSKFDTDVFRKFGEYCAASIMDGTPVIFLSTIHKNFLSYKSQYNEEEFKVISARVKDISMTTNGFEDIISAIIVPDKDTKGWSEYIEGNNKTFKDLTNIVSGMQLFNWLKAKNWKKK